MLFDKATDLTITAADPTAALTLMSADIERIDMGWRTAHDLWANLVEIGIAIYLLERQLGIACLIPVATALVSIVGSIIAVSFVMARQAMWLEAIGKRIAVTSQMLGAMKGVKMCGLTSVLEARISSMRDDELHISGKFRRLLIWNMGLAYLAPILAPIFTFTAYSLLARNQGDGGTLDTNRVFTSLSLFALLQEPLTSFVTSLSSFVGSIGCFSRIQAFLESDVRSDQRLVHDTSNSGSSSSQSTLFKKSNEKSAQETDVDKAGEAQGGSPTRENDVTIKIQDGAFGYASDKDPNLTDISIEVPSSQFTMVVGPVGSGKSTLLKAILGEVALMAGNVHIMGSEIAYCDQTPWHMNGTVRASIIAFSPVDERWYEQVLQACALTQDFRQLPKGDQTTIGSKGIVLSGGQSQRISLARAVYARKYTIILDDVFSGLDAHTENVVFHNLLGSKGLLRRSSTTVVVASSRSNRLSYADYIICLDGTGKGCEQGTFQELSASEGYVSQLLVTSADWTRPSATDPQDEDSAVKHELAQLEEEKDEAGRRTGDIAIYTYYIRAIGWLPTFIFIFAICAFIFCQSFPTIWLNWWAAANAEEPHQRLGYYLGIYAMLGGLALIFLVVSCWQMIVTMVPLSGKNFHSNLLKTVLNAPMSFFAATDAGVTINRFSQDLQLIDMDLPIAALNTFATFVLCIAQLALVAVGSYYTAIAFPFLFAALWLVQHVYLRTSRQLRFMDLEAKSPLYALFTESVTGLATLRAFGWRGALEDRLYNLLDRSQRPFYLLYAVQRWLTLVLDMFVAGIAVLLVFLITQLRGVLPPGLIGVALVNVILFSQNLKLLLMFWTNLETHIGAISRIKSFTTHTKSEHEVQETEVPPPTWPSQGGVEFENVSAGYNGKSSMVSCLFRMIDIHEGRITVDNIDITTIPREDVRTRLVGVPQDAFLIDGSSVRLNADPAEKLSDAAVEDALQLVELWDIVASKGGLDTPIDDLHLSHGQMQLFCIARAMLRPSPIIVLDEATSSVDAHADDLIRRVMKERFSNHTILSIVHKLESALDDFDLVAVLDAGVLVEFGPPRELLQQGVDKSPFAALYESLSSKVQSVRDRVVARTEDDTISPLS
ncbi:Multidrug resistance-associated protein 1 [Emericellopsis cladophorae]|uniref:Multidrug resistance-associated protein 1 n=1 Tax=Emericellopsis cladophorae TaxID=2686198 RepID=A0A9P9Y3D2_9HYPO|nr:Multidrug resistance-associated protein 1 [Emericellopsis cladophorae]KAI6782626.1 Multidrug resistance-associated protein 1 [Emericellopsis cladophorae]